jgi:hypothetical protein
MSQFKYTHVWSPEEKMYVERLVQVPEPSKERPYEDKIIEIGCPVSAMIRGHTHYLSMTMKEFKEGNHRCKQCGRELIFEKVIAE